MNEILLKQYLNELSHLRSEIESICEIAATSKDHELATLARVIDEKNDKIFHKLLKIDGVFKFLPYELNPYPKE